MGFQTLRFSLIFQCFLITYYRFLKNIYRLSLNLLLTNISVRVMMQLSEGKCTGQAFANGTQYTAERNNRNTQKTNKSNNETKLQKT